VVDDCLDRRAQRGDAGELGKNPVFLREEPDRQLIVRHPSVDALACGQSPEKGVLTCGSAGSSRFHRPSLEIK
jgi:hypothetical protein